MGFYFIKQILFEIYTSKYFSSKGNLCLFYLPSFKNKIYVTILISLKKEKTPYELPEDCVTSDFVIGT